jgi:signal transduction histidine kinase
LEVNKKSHLIYSNFILLTDGIEETIILYQNQFKHGIDMQTYLEEIPEFMGYSDELVQAWTNLIYNAIQVMKNKGKLIISTKLKADLDNKTALISVKDTRVSIPLNIQDKIFDAFFTTKREG